MRGRFAELDGMILKTQLFIVLIVAPAKKLWPLAIITHRSSAQRMGHMPLVCDGN